MKTLSASLHRLRQTMLVGIAVALVSSIPSVARAQQRPPRPTVISAGGDPNTPDYVGPRASGFRLFANADGAGIGVHSTGNLGFATDNYSPCGGALEYGSCQFYVRTSDQRVAEQYDEILVAAGVPPSEWRKLRRVAPSVGNATGGGWTYVSNFGWFSDQRIETGPADRSLGTLFSGVRSTADGSCRDNTGFGDGHFFAGLQLLASYDCPATWPATGFGGDHPIREAAWEAQFKRQGSAFRWNYWQVPDSLKTTNLPLGDRLASYGIISDHSAEILAEYGSVIPGGTGAPKFQGYPLGLDWHFQVFGFTDPTLASVVFWRATVVNRSADVYGTGVAYDSLYLGFEVGASSSPDLEAGYFRPDLGAMVNHESGVVPGGPCTESWRSAPVGPRGCAYGIVAGYGNGGTAILVLKSPIGDLRNKLFTHRADGTLCTMETDPFCDPENPERGDTITYNHGHLCGYNPCWEDTYAVNERRSFGMISSTADNAIDGQTLYPDAKAFQIFHNEGFPAVLGKFNKYVPGSMGPPAATWDYNHDGVPDTLFYDTCGSHGCVAQDWDTLPSGLINAYENGGGIVSAGPFVLPAGDSTSWFVAFVGESDSVRTWRAINAAINSYLEFFPQPDPAPPPQIVATQVTPGTDAGANARPRVTLVFDHTTEDWVDPYVVRFADGRAADSSLTARQVSDIRARAADNVAALEIYKSCDGGKTFTADASCAPAPITDLAGQSVGTGWRPYAVMPMLENPRHLPNTFTDTAVTAGRTYTYVVVTRTKGVTVPTQAGQTLPVAPVMRSALIPKTYLPQVAQVYVPVSRLAGAVPTQVAFTARATTATVPFTITPTNTVELNSYTARFGDWVVVDQIHGGPAGALTATRVTIGRHALLSDSAGLPKSDLFFDQHPYTLGGADSIAIGPTRVSQQPVVLGDTTRQILEGLRFVLTQQGVPIYVSGDLALDSAGYAPADAMIESRRDPGFTIDAAERLKGRLIEQVRLDSAGHPVVADESLNQSVELAWDSLSDSTPGGEYRFTWQGDPYNAPLGITVDTAAQQATRAELTAALQRRPVTSVGATDATTAALLGVPQGDLVPVALPFTVYNETLQHPVRVAMVRQGGRSLRVGAGSDTVRVALPSNIWVPGDSLWLVEDVVVDSFETRDRIRLGPPGIRDVLVLGPNGLPLTTTQTVLAGKVVLGCRVPALRCNPTAGADSDRYVPIPPGSQSVLTLGRGFAPGDSIAFTITAPKTGLAGPVTQAMLEQIRVVPNPFVLYSAYQNTLDGSQILFTNMPAAGTLRIYTVAGQFVQQVTWTALDLDGSGDLHFDLKTRSGEDMATGLYVWVVMAAPTLRPGQPGSLRARGKFVVIRGTGQ